MFFFFFKQKTSYVMRFSDWSADVCSSDLIAALRGGGDRSSKPHRLPHTARQQTNTPPSRNRSGSRLVSALDRLSSKLDLSVLPSNRTLGPRMAQHAAPGQ